MKKICVTLASVSILLTSIGSFAQDIGQQQPPTGGPFSQETTLLNQIANEINGLPSSMGTSISQGFTNMQSGLEQFLNQLYTKAITWVTTKNHTPNPNLPAITAENSTTIPAKNVLPQQAITPSIPSNLTPTQISRFAAQEKTMDNVQNSLTQFLYSMNQGQSAVKNLKTADGSEDFSTYMNNNSTEALSVGQNATASDTLYVMDDASKASPVFLDPNNKNLLAQPQAINNAPFDFSTVITPASYSSDQINSAKLFLTYAARSTENLLGSIDLSPLYSNPKALLQVKKSPDYQAFVMTIRNAVALRSIPLNILNQLIAERTPVAGLGSAIGQSSNQNASPLQVESYRATHDLETPSWYQGIENAEPATVQRDILITLKEIERQNYEQKLQNEQLLAAMAALSMQMNATNLQTTVQLQAQKVQEVIQNAVKATTSAPKKDTNTGAPQFSRPPSVEGTPKKTTANLSWGAVQNAPKGVTVVYNITAKPNNGGKALIFNANASLSVQLTGLQPGTSYSVTVSADNAQDNSQIVSAQTSFSTAG